MQARSLVKERARRNLLLLVDGVKTDVMLLDGLAGVSLADLQELRDLGLIAPVAAPSTRSGRTTTASALGAFEPLMPTAPAPLDYGQFTAALTQIISSELGLRGFVLTLALERANTPEELQAVAARTLAQIADRKGEARAAAARRTLYGH